jgi:hypothetical protein
MRLTSAIAAAILVAVSIGCRASDAERSPAAPSTASAASQPTTLGTFGGTWTSGAATGSSTPGLPNGCTQFDYKITPAPDGQSAAVDFAATCASISVRGKGTATLAGSTLTWGAEGTVGLGAAPVCPFSFFNSTATREGDGIRITYSGTVCGVPVSGSELLRRK